MIVLEQRRPTTSLCRSSVANCTICARCRIRRMAGLSQYPSSGYRRSGERALCLAPTAERLVCLHVKRKALDPSQSFSPASQAIHPRPSRMTLDSARFWRHRSAVIPSIGKDAASVPSPLRRFCPVVEGKLLLARISFQVKVELKRPEFARHRCSCIACR